jgi:hypothetical protein
MNVKASVLVNYMYHVGLMLVCPMGALPILIQVANYATSTLYTCTLHVLTYYSALYVNGRFVSEPIKVKTLHDH